MPAVSPIRSIPTEPSHERPPAAGTFHIQAQERIVFGVPAGEAVVAEAERVGAKRVFVTSTRSLAQKENGPLQRMEKALGARHVGTYSTISSHSPREDVVAGAKAAREAKADLLVAVGGGSVIDATKAHAAVPLDGARQPRGHGALLPRLRAHQVHRHWRCRPIRSA